jgi:pimeloyl-ACP methyl ester carboxylesterase
MGQEGVTTIALQGIDLRLVRRGKGPPMVLLHGGDGPQDHLPFFNSLTAQFDVIAPIHPGFAGSAIPDHFDTMEDLVYLYLDLLDVFDLRDVLLLGLCMGGWAAVEMAVRNTHRIAKLILVDAVGIKPGNRETRDIADIFGMPDADVAPLLFHDPRKRPSLTAMSDEQVAAVAADRVAYALYTWHPYMHNPKLRYRLHRIDVPTLLIWGASDGLVSVAYAKAYRAMIPSARLAVIPAAGHLPQVEQPDVFLDHLLSFATQ